MLILGIDPGLNTTGYGIIAKEESKISGWQKRPLSLIEAGFIRTSAKEDLGMRLLKIYRSLSGVISKYKIDAVALEKLYAHYEHPITASLLGHARGVICLVCMQNNLKLFEYEVTRVKKSISGNGRATKLQIQNMVLNFLGLANPMDVKGMDKISLDTTDALSLAIAHAQIAR